MYRVSSSGLVHNSFALFACDGMRVCVVLQNVINSYLSGKSLLLVYIYVE